MKIEAKSGLSHTLTRVVRDEDSAARYGSGLLPVFATPAMVGLMEAAANEAIQPYLPEGFITLGTEINVKHLKATPVGWPVECTATLETIEDRKLTFRIIARDPDGMIGEATHQRFVVNAERFMEKLNKGIA
ncbi:MAG: thioesterase family protein [Bacteroidales bacterium]